MFEPVEIDANIGGEVFHSWNREWTSFHFYQSATTTPWRPNENFNDTVLRNQLIDVLSPNYGVHYFKNEYDFDICLSYGPGGIPMAEHLAIYAVMFYLSSLVRYRPDYLELMLATRPSWLIETFVVSCSVTFLRLIISRIVGQELILSRR